MVVAALAALLAGCATGAPSAQPTPSPTVNDTPTPTPEPEKLVLGVSEVSVVDSAGTVTASAPYTEPDTMVAFLTTTLGSDPTFTDTSGQKGGARTWEWPGVRASTSWQWIIVSVTLPEAAGLIVQTTSGIHVGSTRDEVAAAPGLVGLDYDGDGDGLPDRAGIEAQPSPGHELLSRPGEEGVDFVGVGFAGDVVVSIWAFGSDWMDL